MPINQSNQIAIPANEECLVCHEEASDIAKDQGSNSVLQTTCCKQLLCNGCLNKVKASKDNACPHCRRKAEFKTTRAMIEQSQPKPIEPYASASPTEKSSDSEFINDLGLSQAQMEKIVAEQFLLEKEIADSIAEEASRMRQVQSERVRLANAQSDVDSLPLSERKKIFRKRNALNLRQAEEAAIAERRPAQQDQLEQQREDERLAAAILHRRQAIAANPPAQAPSPNYNPFDVSSSLHSGSGQLQIQPARTTLPVVINQERQENPQDLLHRAIANDSLEGLQDAIRAIRAGASVHTLKDNKSPLLWAVLLRKENAVETLLNLGAIADKGLVQHAIDLRAYRIACLLAIKGNINANELYFYDNQRRQDSTTLMRILIINNQHEYADYLAQEKPEFISNCDTLVKEIATRFDNNRVISTRLIQAIIQRGYNVNNIWTLTEGGNRTALITGIYNPHLLRLFIAARANPNIVIDINYPRTISGGSWTITPLLKTIDLCNTEAARILINAGADVNQRGNISSHQQPSTPLAYAIQRGAAEIVQMLLERGANL